MAKSGLQGATLRHFFAMNDLRDFGGNVHRAHHVSSPLFRAACLARVEDRRSIGQRRWDALHPQQQADMLASAEVT